MRMSALLPNDRPRWMWPASLAGALVLLVVAVLLPDAWWSWLWPSATGGRPPVAPSPAGDPITWTIVLPPPVIEVVPEPADTAPATDDHDLDWLPADWWQTAWHDAAAIGWPRRVIDLPDALLPVPLVVLMGTQATLDLILAAPDSAVAAVIWRLEQTASLTRDDRDGLYTAIARARAYAYLKSREAAMYGEFLLETVPITR